MSTPSRVESIFFAALGKKTTAERADYLDHACGGDAELRRRVERLLEAHPQAVDFMARPAVERPGGDTLDLVPHPPGYDPTDRPTRPMVTTAAADRRGHSIGKAVLPDRHRPFRPTSTADLPRIAECPIVTRLCERNGRSPILHGDLPTSRRHRSPIPESPATSVRNRLVISGRPAILLPRRPPGRRSLTGSLRTRTRFPAMQATSTSTERPA